MVKKLDIFYKKEKKGAMKHIKIQKKYSNKNITTPSKKKQYGQHFLRKQSVVDNMINKVRVSNKTTVLEIGCGDGFLTKSILQQTHCKSLLCYEIDQDWIEVVQRNISDQRLELRHENILDVKEKVFNSSQPLVILANLPYQITFPILFLFHTMRQHIQEGVIMIQEEVAQKIKPQNGKKYNATSLFLQHYFDIELLEKIEPEAFLPAPKVFSRLVYFCPKKNVESIENEDAFWKFVKMCFASPRRTLRNNIQPTKFKEINIPESILSKRAQQMTIDDFLWLWNKVYKA
jgi:16S rRNA (adenine1518-N6/adenine1519-N6)-dimethyltransferase